MYYVVFEMKDTRLIKKIVKM